MSPIHRKWYFLHFRPRTVPAAALRYTYTFGLGGMATNLILLLLVTGLLLKFVYTPIPEKAYGSILTLQQAIQFGGFVRNIHHWSANLLVVAVFLHLLRVFFTGAYTGKRGLNWMVGMGLLGTVLLANFTGYLLPWDQLAYWAVTVCAGALRYLPFIGGWLQEALLGGLELSAVSLSNFFAVHTALLPAVLLLLLPFHFWRIRKAGGLAAKGEEKIETFPYLLVREATMALAVTAMVFLLAAVWDAPLGPKANPGLSPNPTKAPWYFAGFQELLLHLHPVVAVAVIPTAVAIGLVMLPFLPIHPKTPGRWFGSPLGWRAVAGAALLALVVTPIWIVTHARGLNLQFWLAPLLYLFLTAALAVVLPRRPGASGLDGVQAVVAFLVTAFLFLTIVGVWCRGPAMALVWPWR